MQIGRAEGMMGHRTAWAAVVAKRGRSWRERQDEEEAGTVSESGLDMVSKCSDDSGTIL